MPKMTFVTKPITQGPGMVRRPAVGPTPHVDCEPTSGDVAVGKVRAGPMPQVRAAGLAGETKALKLMSPRPVVAPSPATLLGLVTRVTMLRVMTLTGPAWMGMTGWKLRTFCTSLVGP